MHFRGATRILRLVFTRPISAEPADAAGDRQTEFVAYAADRLLAGLIDLRADRLTDLLNGVDEVELIDVVVQRLDDGQLSEVDRVVLARADLLAVRADEPRGNPARRQRTRAHPIAAGLEQYFVHGYLHARPGADPMITLGRRPSMIPVTDGIVRYSFHGEPRRDGATTLILNRDRVDWLQPMTEEDALRLSDSLWSREPWPEDRLNLA